MDMYYLVKGVKYKVIYKKMDSLHGECDQDKKIIYIDDNKDTAKIACRIHAHELAHAYVKELLLDSVVSSDVQEMICNLVEDLVDDHIETLMDIKHGSN
jgi:hypothetical protein